VHPRNLSDAVTVTDAAAALLHYNRFATDAIGPVTDEVTYISGAGAPQIAIPSNVTVTIPELRVSMPDFHSVVDSFQDFALRVAVNVRTTDSSIDPHTTSGSIPAHTTSTKVDSK
jgi:hypothetical protein